MYVVVYCMYNYVCSSILYVCICMYMYVVIYCMYMYVVVVYCMYMYVVVVIITECVNIGCCLKFCTIVVTVQK